MLQDTGKKVMVFGTFDIVHFGHIHLFEKAKEYADELVIIVARDKNVEKIKGVAPLHSEEERKTFLSYIKLVDAVYLGSEEDPYAIIQQIKPDVIALGYDQRVFVDQLADAITDMGLEIQIVRIPEFVTDRFKTSKIKEYLHTLM
ncbi:FAD synthase [Patescibacteria group bacterium]|nr:FAD synthase [Patescibacteria group bacterium]MBU1721972.1 FAD synthase [Patescibacteria group bacterium]MBU1901280.1 FAD synthase [Patescibacteria group bacterium]